MQAVTQKANGWFEKDKDNGFKFWANNRAVTTNGDKKVLAELDRDFKVRNVIIRLCPESEFNPQEVEGGGFMGYIHESRLITGLAGASRVQEARVQEAEAEVVVDALTDSGSDDPDDSTFHTGKSPAPTYRTLCNEVNNLHEDPPMAANSKESLLLEKIEVLKRRLKESELL